MAKKNDAAKTTSTKAKADKAAAKGKKQEAPVEEKAPRAKRDGLNKACVRVLYALNLAAKKKPGACLTKTRINEVLGKDGKDPYATKNTESGDQGWMYAAIGSTDKAVWAQTEERTGYPNLQKLKYIEHVEVEDDAGKQEDTYRITAAGKKALEAAIAEE